MTKEDEEDFVNSTKCWIWDNAYIDEEANVKDHCHVTGKYKGSADKDCNLNVKLNRKNPYCISQPKEL